VHRLDSFTSERGAPFGTAGFARMVERAGTVTKLGFKVHPHMLRHACGYALANKGHDTRALQAYLGHRNIQLGTVAKSLSFRKIRPMAINSRGDGYCRANYPKSSSSNDNFSAAC